MFAAHRCASATVDSRDPLVESVLIATRRPLLTSRVPPIDRLSKLPRVLEELLPATCHITEQCANNSVEADHGRLKSRLRMMRGLKRLRSTRVISTGHAFVQNLRRGHYELGVDEDRQHRLPVAFAELALAV